MSIKLKQYNIWYMGESFKEHFGSMKFTIPKKLKLQHKVLKRNMLDEEILAEFKPKESTLGEFLWALKNEKSMLKDGCANIFYIRDEEKTLWAVRAYWRSFRRGWGVGAGSVERPGGWGAGRRVLSRIFDSEVELLNSWNLDSEILEIKGKKYKLKIQ